MAYKKLDAKNLKDVLWHTLNSTKSGTTDPRNSLAIAAQARAILQTLHMQQKIAKQLGTDLPQDVKEF